MTVELGEGFWSKVNKDADGGCWEWTARTHRGYGLYSSRGSSYRAHRLTWEWAKGAIPEDLVIDHMCHNTACVNPAHLRLATRSQNQHNRVGAQRNSSSGIRGVFQKKGENRWRARVKINGKYHHLGGYATSGEAEAAVVAWRREHMPYSLMDQLG